MIQLLQHVFYPIPLLWYVSKQIFAALLLKDRSSHGFTSIEKSFTTLQLFRDANYADENNCKPLIGPVYTIYNALIP